MDFSQVKAITIPEGNVNRILSGATVLWEKIGGLPSEYQQVEYIANSGTQYIDTGKNIDLGDDIELKFSINTSSYSDAAKLRIFGAAQGGNNIYQMNMLANVGCLNIFKKSVSAVTVGQTYLQYPNGSTALTNDTIYTIKTDGLTILVNGTTLGTLTQPVTTGEISNSAMTIFARRNGGTVDSIADCGMKVYGYKRWDGNGNLIQNLIPCYRKSDGVAGMYDTVTGTFFTNAGTGVFTVGPDIITLPAGYQRVEYIRTTNDGGQWIDTGVPGENSNLRIDISYMWDVVPPSGSYQNIISAYINETSNCTRIIQYGSSITYVDINIRANRSVSYNGTRVAGVRYNESLTGTYYDVNGSRLVITEFATGSSNNHSLHLFSGSVHGAYAKSLRLYSCRLYNGNTIVRDFIPCYRKSDGEPGLYDIVGGTFYTNGGTGAFTLGPEHYPLPSGYQQVEYLESSGTQVINTGIPINIIGNNSTNFKLKFEIPATNNGGTLMGANDSRKQMVLTGQRIRTDWVNGSSSGYLVTGLSVLTPYIIEQKNGYLSCNGQSAEITTTATDTLPCGLFARIDRAAGTTFNNLATTRIYGFTAENSGGAICDMVPCYRESDNEPGMYDLVREAFYTNVGTGVFTLGPDV